MEPAINAIILSAPASTAFPLPLNDAFGVFGAVDPPNEGNDCVTVLGNETLGLTLGAWGWKAGCSKLNDGVGVGVNEVDNKDWGLTELKPMFLGRARVGVRVEPKEFEAATGVELEKPDRMPPKTALLESEDPF